MEDWKQKLAALTGNHTTQIDATPTQASPTPPKRKQRTGVVYSTNPQYSYNEAHDSEPSTLPPQQQKLRISMERAGRGGKTVTIVRGFVGNKADMLALCKLLKQQCGIGGSAKQGDIILQGDHRTQVCEKLKSLGYTQTK